MKASVDNDILKNSISGRKCLDDEQKGRGFTGEVQERFQASSCSKSLETSSPGRPVEGRWTRRIDVRTGGPLEGTWGSSDPRQGRTPRTPPFAGAPEPVDPARPVPALLHLGSGYVRMRVCASGSAGRVLPGSPALRGRRAQEFGPSPPGPVVRQSGVVRPDSRARHRPRVASRHCRPRRPAPPAFLAGRGAASPRDTSPPPVPGHMGGTAAASVTVLAAGVEPPSPPPADGAGIPVPGPRRPAPAASVGRPGLGPTVMERGGTSAGSV